MVWRSDRDALRYRPESRCLRQIFQVQAAAQGALAVSDQDDLDLRAASGDPGRETRVVPLRYPGDGVSDIRCIFMQGAALVLEANEIRSLSTTDYESAAKEKWSGGENAADWNVRRCPFDRFVREKMASPPATHNL